MLGRPFGAGQMTFKCIARTIWLFSGVNMQHNPYDFAPISTVPIRIE
jgi:hypothetical protein